MPPVAKPASELIYRCAGPNCDQIKRKGEHWWMMWPSKQGNLTLLSLSAWDEELAMREAAMSVCGEECAQRLQSMFIANILEHQQRHR